MLHVGTFCLGHAVVVDVDHVIEHAHGGVDGALQLLDIQAVFVHVLGQVHGTQVTHGDFFLVGVQGDLGAQVGGVHHAHVLLRAAQVARILEGEPGVACFKQHGEHLAPQVDGGDALEQLHFAAAGFRFVFQVRLLERFAVQIVQVRGVVGAEQGPLFFVDHALHEQIRNPVGAIHVVGAATVVTGVLAQLQEFFDVHVPGFQVGTDGALALATLVNGNGGIIDHFQERHHAL